MEKEMINIIDKNGVEREAEVLAVFNSEEYKKDYIIYTFGDKQNEMTKIFASTLKEDEDNYSFEDIESDEEWAMIKNTIKELSKEEVKTEAE